MTSGFFEINSGNSISRLQQSACSVNSDGRELERLALMQHRASRNYFRLLEAHNRLRARVAPQRNVGAILADSLDAERKRVGRELHTGVGQALAGIYIHVSLAESHWPDSPEPVRKSLSQITALAETALEQVRAVSRRLYIPLWQAQPLPDALRSLWDTSGISAKFQASLELGDLHSELTPDLRRAIYLVAQEGISNVIRHSNASRVRMAVRQEGDQLVLEIVDDGSRVAAAAEPAVAPSGIGLRSMRDLALDLGGDLHFQATPHGNQLTLHLPVIA